MSSKKPAAKVATPTKAAAPAPSKKAAAQTFDPLGDESSWLSPVMKYSALGLICLISFSIRLFAVARWESVIHEFDPWFNYRTTKYLSSEGFYDFLNWFDDRAWYPLGRIIGGTIYPGLMATAAALHSILNTLNISINVRNMCVFLAPIFAANTAIATYLLTKEAVNRSSTALLAAAFVGIVPSYISRSVAGSYDNEGVAIFALIFTFYFWVKAVKTGSMLWAVGCALVYFYMVAAWGGYVFIINIIPIYVVILIASGRYSPRLYVAYTTFYVVGSLLAMQVPFVGFNVIKQAECLASHGAFAVLHVYLLVTALRSHITSDQFRYLAYTIATTGVAALAVFLLFLQLTGRTQWTGRSLTLLDPTYAKKFIPIIASVSEHQPTAWTSFFFDLHIMVPFAPVGLYFLFQRLNDNGDAKIFLILYGTIAWYFAGVMVRLMLTLAPIACILGAIGISGILNAFAGHAKKSFHAVKAALMGDAEEETQSEGSAGAILPAVISFVVLLTIGGLTVFYAMHASFVASEAYSSPSIVLATTRADGSRAIMDDFREAYYWLRHNTDPNAKVMSWWDYGYQISGMANRTVLVDNNTWNNTHIATVGRAMSSTEKDAYPIMQSLDVDYVLVIFGGMTGYSGDDINKFLWMVRIGGGVFPHIKEPDYFGGGQYRMDAGGSPTMLNCMMYKASYYRFDELKIDYSRPAGFDRARNVEIGHKGFELDVLDEAFTSEHWIVRIFKVKKPSNLMPTVNAPSQHPSRRRRDAAKSPTSSKAEAAEPELLYRGCYTDENMLGTNRVYSGHTTGAHLSLAKHHAMSLNKQFVGLARSGTDGHAFAFDGPLPEPDSTARGCSMPCLDDNKKACGCADHLCPEATPAGREHNRQWVVYELVQPKKGKGGKKSSGY